MRQSFHLQYLTVAAILILIGCAAALGLYCGSHSEGFVEAKPGQPIKKRSRRAGFSIQQSMPQVAHEFADEDKMPVNPGKIDQVTFNRLHALALKTPETVLHELAKWQNDGLCCELRTHALMQWAARNLPAAWQWLVSQPYDVELGRAMVLIMTNWAENEPHQAARFVESWPESRLRDNLMRQLSFSSDDTGAESLTPSR